MKMPDTVELCGLCEGRGEYRQYYLEGRFHGTCDMCKGMQFVYISGDPVPASVVNQIAVANGLREELGVGGLFYCLEPTP